MIRSRKTLFFSLAFIAFVSVACGAALQAGAPPPATEEPYAPEMTAPAEEPMEEEAPAEEPMEEAPSEEPPAAEQPPTLLVTPSEPTPMPTATLASLQPTQTVATSTPETGVVENKPQPVIPEKRLLALEFPPVMRSGDSTRIRLTLEVDDQGNILPTAMVEDNVVTGEVVEIPNLYETHRVIAEARLDMAGLEVQPAGTISEPLLQGQSVTFYWSVHPENAGNYEGTAWLHLRFIPKNGGQEMRIPVSVQFLEIKATSFLGFLSGGTARGMGAVGSVLGTVLGFPFIDDLLRFLVRKLGKLRK